MALSDYQTFVDSLVRDNARVITPAERDRAIGMALQAYGHDMPRSVVEDVTWAAYGYTAALPLQWTARSEVLAAEYPIGQRPAAAIEMAVYIEPLLSKLITPNALPAGALVRVTYSTAHSLADGGAAANDTVPTMHREAMASYAAYLLCRQLAAHYSAERDSSINADASNTESRARNYSARANDYRAMYYAGIGKADPQAKGGGAGATAGSGGAGQPAAAVTSWAGRGRFNTGYGAGYDHGGAL